MEKPIEYAYLTDIGLRRRHNEDAVEIFRNDYLILVVVADGVGGHAAGDVASKKVLDHFSARFHDQLTFNSKEDAVAWLNETIYKIHEDILAYSKRKGAKHMATTLVCAMIMDEYIVFCHIGDSRAYINAYGKLRQITKDHTFVRELLDKGQISERAASLHPRKNVLNKALGTGEKLEFDVITVDRYDMHSLMICTDGLTGHVPDREIKQILNTRTSVRDKVATLVESANRKGGKDNISVALVEFPGSGRMTK